MIRLLFSKYRHSVARFIVLTFVMCLAVVFLSLGMQLYMQSVKSMQIIEDNTITIALENAKEQSGEYIFDIETLQSVWVDHGQDQLKQASQSPSVVALQQGTTVSAHIEGLFPVLPTAEQNFIYRQFDIDLLASRAMLSAFRIRVDRVYLGKYVEETDEFGYRIQENGKAESAKTIYSLSEYEADATVLECLLINEQQYVPSEKIRLSCSYRADDGTALMEAGKEYVIFCIYDDLMPVKDHSPVKGILYKRDSVNTSTMYLRLLPYDYGYSPFVLQDKLFIQKDGKWYAEQLIPQFAQDYPFILAVDDPRVEEMLAWVKLNSELITVTGIHTANSLPIFAWEDAYIAEGRDISVQEDQAGAQVCLISKAFADYHKLKIGDTLPMSLYQNQWYEEVGTSSKQWELPYAGDMHPAAICDYEIVGIYVAPEWVYSNYTFSPNTILVPESSIPVEGQTGLNYATSLILQNGSNEEFLDDIKSMGLDETYFMIYDGGYMEFMESLQLMQKDTRLVLIVCILLYLVVALSALYMMTNHLKQDASIMMKVGASSGYTVRYMLCCLLPVILFATIIAYGVSCVVYAPLMQTLEQWYTLIRPPYSNLTSGSVGMLTNTMSRIPSPLGAVTGCSMAALMMILLTIANKKEVNRK